MTERPTRSRGYQVSVGLMTRERPFGWVIESTHYHRPKMVICELVNGLVLTPLLGAYLPPSNIKHLPDLEEALKRFKKPIVLGDLNVDLEEARILRSQRVADLFAEYGLIDLVRHLR